MGVSYGKKKEHFPGRSETHVTKSASEMQAHQHEEEERCPVLLAFPSQLQSEEESDNLIKPQKPLNPLTASKSHQELHKELQMTHKRRVSKQEKTELQQALEKRKWEQRMKATRDKEEANKSTTPLHQKLLRRHQQLEQQLEKEEKGQQRDEPEFLRVKERLRRTEVQEKNKCGSYDS